MNPRIQQIMDFLILIDQLKYLYRRTPLSDNSRQESDAEHMWHITMFALLLHKDLATDVDIVKVLKMCLIHDLVEIETGDTWLFDTQAREEAHQKELDASQVVFGKLPDDLRDELLPLFLEFEEQQTPEAKFAKSLDRLSGVTQHYAAGGKVWKQHNLTANKVLNAQHHDASQVPAVYELIKSIVADAVVKGYIDKD